MTELKTFVKQPRFYPAKLNCPLVNCNVTWQGVVFGWFKPRQDCYETGIWMFIFPDREKNRKLI